MRQRDLERSQVIKFEVCSPGSEVRRAGHTSGNHGEAGDLIYTSMGARNSWGWGGGAVTVTEGPTLS